MSENTFKLMVCDPPPHLIHAGETAGSRQNTGFFHRTGKHISIRECMNVYIQGSEGNYVYKA